MAIPVRPMSSLFEDIHNMTWHVIIFRNENSVEAVPANWFVDQTSECFWPPKSYKADKVLKLIISKADPESDWKVFQAKLLGTYELFKTAREKAIKAMETTDISSNSEVRNSGMSSRRKRRQNRKFIDIEAPLNKVPCQRETDDSNISSNSDDDNLYPPKQVLQSLFSTKSFKKVETQRKPSEISEHELLNAECSQELVLGKPSLDDPSGEQLPNMTISTSQGIIGQSKKDFDQKRAICTPKQRRKESSTFVRYRSRSFSPVNRISTEKNLHRTLDDDFLDTIQAKKTNLPYSLLAADSRMHSEIAEPGCSGVPVNPGQDKVISTVSSGTTVVDNEFKKLVAGELTHLHLKVNAMFETVNTILAVLNRRETTGQANVPFDRVYEFTSKLPVKNMIELTEVENWLGQDNNYKLMVEEFRRMGGQSLPQAIRKILYRAISNEVAQEYSWDGAKKKSAFKSLALARGILDSIKQQYPQSFDHDIINVIKVWLVKAKERVVKRKEPVQEVIVEAV